MARDGFLYLPGLLEPADLVPLRRDVTALLQRFGWLQPGMEPLEALAGELRTRAGEPQFQALYRELQKLERFHRLGQHPQLLAVARELIGGEVFVHPRSIARIIFPDYPASTTPPHQDYVHIQSTDEFAHPPARHYAASPSPACQRATASASVSTP